MTATTLPARVFVSLLLIVGVLVVPTMPPPGTPSVAAEEVVRVALSADGDWWRSGALTRRGVLTASADLDGRQIELRWQKEGDWSPWTAFPEAGEHAPDPRSSEAQRVQPWVSDPVWTGAHRIEVRADGPGPVRLHLSAQEGSLAFHPAAVPHSTATASGMWPPIVPRDRWDPAGECQPTKPVRYADRVQRIYVHHTAIFPEYPPEAGDDAVRAICLGHVRKRGFDDIGYNFLIDRYGVIYQGRRGGVLRPVIGAHASGFNRGSVGIALIGNFQREGVPAAAVDALDTLTAWLADHHGIDPFAVTAHRSEGGKTTRFPESTLVEMPTVVGHRDTALNSQCPGHYLYELVANGHMARRIQYRLEVDYGHAHREAPAPPAIGAVAVGTAPGPEAEDEGDGDAEQPAAADDGDASAAALNVARSVAEVVREFTDGGLAGTFRGLVGSAGVIADAEPWTSVAEPTG